MILLTKSCESSEAPVLLFLHADTHLPPAALAELQAWFL